MTSNFQLPCCDKDTSRKVLFTSNIIIAILGLMHFGYAGSIGNYLNLHTTFKSYGKAVESIIQ